MSDQGFSREHFYQLSSEQHGLRKPESIPRCLNSNAAQPLQPDMHRGGESTDRDSFCQGQPATKVFDYSLAASGQQKPVSMFKAMQQAHQRSEPPKKYIPGLTPKTQEAKATPAPNPHDIKELKKKTPKKVPPELVEAFLNGSKNPVSALTEYSAMSRLETIFRECPIAVSSIVTKFANECSVDGRVFPQGTGKTKKEAKNNAAKIAFTMLLGLEEEDVEQEDSGRVMFDSLGRKIVIGKDEFRGASVKYEQVTTAETSGGTQNPVSALQEYCSRKRLPFSIDISDEPGLEGYEAVVIVDDEPIAREAGDTKKEAKREAAEAAINFLMIHQPMSPEDTEDEDETLFDKIGDKSLQAINKRLSCIPQYAAGRKTVAAFVVKRAESDPGLVVAIGTGNTCNHGDCLSMDGRTLNDSHAEVIARRSLMRYFHREIKLYYEGNVIHSIFGESSTDSSMLSLKDNISIHMYISTAPCGDAANFMPSSGDQTPPPLTVEEFELVQSGAHYPNFDLETNGLLRMKTEHDGSVGPIGGGGTSPIQLGSVLLQTWEGLMAGERLKTMSCSDKIVKWNVLGLQGCLYSHFVEPVYLTSLTVGDLFDHGHLTRAVCCRVEDAITDKLTNGFRLNHPYIGRVTFCESHKNPMPSKMLNWSVNWSLDDEKIEIINGRVGKAVPESPFKTSASLASRICKAGFFHRFKELAKLSKKFRLLKARNYYEAKQMCQPYQHAKHVLYDYLRTNGFGSWIHKPAEQGVFAK